MSKTRRSLVWFVIFSTAVSILVGLQLRSSRVSVGGV